MTVMRDSEQSVTMPKIDLSAIKVGNDSEQSVAMPKIDLSAIRVGHDSDERQRAVSGNA